MRILAISVAPLFPDRVMGGSQRILMEVVDGLAEDGHEVRVLCPAESGEASHFCTRAGVDVLPILQLKGSFPAPYQTAPHRLRSVRQVLAEHAEWADRAYLHADAIYMRDALGELPLVRSLHDFVYEEALLSAFTLKADRTIVPSAYMADCIEASTGRLLNVGEITVVPNGVFVPEWPVSPRIPAGLQPRDANDIVLLHPHRLQPEKGIKQSMLIAAGLQRRNSDRKVRLFVPAHPPGGSADEAELQNESVLDIARSVRAEELIELHSWLSPEQMPGYYACGDVTLCSGSFVEAFGLVPLESVAAGTPAVCARVGALREHEGVKGVSHFDYGDVEAAVDVIEELLEAVLNPEEAANPVSSRYSLADMRASYVEAIAGELTDSRSSPAAEPNDKTGLSLAPWCYVKGDRIYHDYLARFERFPLITARLSQEASETRRALFATSAKEQKLEDEVQRALADGFLVLT